MANGGEIQVAGNDGAGVSAYLGYGANTTGNLEVTGYNRHAELQSKFVVDSGSMIVGFNGTGNLLVDQGGNATIFTSDDTAGLYLGYNVGSNGTLTIQDVVSCNNVESVVNIYDNALITGYNGNGTINLQNGGYLNASGFDGSFWIGAYCRAAKPILPPAPSPSMARNPIPAIVLRWKWITVR